MKKNKKISNLRMFVFCQRYFMYFVFIIYDIYLIIWFEEKIKRKNLFVFKDDFIVYFFKKGLVNHRQISHKIYISNS